MTGMPHSTGRSPSSKSGCGVLVTGARRPGTVRRRRAGCRAHEVARDWPHERWVPWREPWAMAANRGGAARDTTDGLADADGAQPKESADGAEPGGVVPIQMEGDCPVVVREKFHAAGPVSVDQALLEMELVGHDFYLFRDEQCGLPSVVYRRRGYQYGLIRLVEEAGTGMAATRGTT